MAYTDTFDSPNPPDSSSSSTSRFHNHYQTWESQLSCLFIILGFVGLYSLLWASYKRCTRGREWSFARGEENINVNAEVVMDSEPIGVFQLSFSLARALRLRSFHACRCARTGVGRVGPRCESCRSWSKCECECGENVDGRCWTETDEHEGEKELFLEHLVYEGETDDWDMMEWSTDFSVIAFRRGYRTCIVPCFFIYCIEFGRTNVVFDRRGEDMLLAFSESSIQALTLPICSAL
ncbi:hypothetical protein C8F01DRAFT_1106680 [Mycena amicta]|nr:hypothetical protein C8F01DRAFT_1106680 [Mycena amicta]